MASYTHWEMLGARDRAVPAIEPYRMSQPGLLWFLARLQEAVQQGRTPDASWICQDAPQHASVIQHALEQLADLARRNALGSEMPLATTLAPPRSGARSDDTQPSPVLDSTLEPPPTASNLGAPPSYEILGVLGRGGMGVVYRARQVALNRIVALKMILGGGHADSADQARFLAEAEAIAAVSHPGIVAVYEFGTFQGLPFLAMEYCSGGSLAQKLNGSPLAPCDAATLVASLARATQAAHAAGIIHRDLKPANILLAADGSPRITDFGLARRVESESNLTRTGALIGTPSYMAPEQAGSSRAVGPAADVYSLGAILYECLTGRPPFKGATALETVQQVIESDPVPVRRLQPRVPRDLETICLECLRKDPTRRYGTAAALADDCDRFLAGKPVRARPVGAIERSWKLVRRHPISSMLSLALGLSLISGSIVSSRLAYKAHARAELAHASELEARKALEVAGQIAVLLVSNVLAPLQLPEVNRNGLRNQGMTLAELNALEDLATLPPEIDRIQLIEHVLIQPEMARKLSWRLDPVGRALIGLNVQRADACLAVAQEKVMAPDVDYVIRLVCARLIARVGGTREPMASKAIDLILDLVDNPSRPGARVSALHDLRILASKLEPASAARLVKRIIEIAPEADPITLELLAQTCRLACERLPPAERQDGHLARILVARLAQTAKENKDLGAVWQLMRAFGAVGDRLDRNEALEVVLRVVPLAEKANQPAAAEAAAEILRILSGRIDEAVVRKLQGRLALLALRLVPTTKETQSLAGLEQVLLCTLPSETARVVGDVSERALLIDTLARSIEATSSAAGLVVLGKALLRLADCKPAPERSRLAAKLSDRLLPFVSIDRMRDPQHLVLPMVGSIAGLLEPAQARVQLARIDKQFLEGTRFDSTDDLVALEVTALLVGATAARLPIAEARPMALRVESAIRSRLKGALDPDALRHLTRAFAAVAKLLPAGQARELGDHLGQRVRHRLEGVKNPVGLAALADAWAAVGPWLPDERRRDDAKRLAAVLLGLATQESRLLELHEVERALRDLNGWVDEETRHRICAAYAPIVVRQVVQQKWMVDAASLLSELTGPLTVAELVDLVRQPACIGPTEQAVLDALSDRLGVRFLDVWELARWLEKNRPDIDLSRPLPEWTFRRRMGS